MGAGLLDGVLGGWVAVGVVEGEAFGLSLFEA